VVIDAGKHKCGKKTAFSKAYKKQKGSENGAFMLLKKGFKRMTYLILVLKISG